MTSSLVGSEMCIRDRPAPHQTPCDSSQQTAVSPMRFNIWEFTMGSLCACLLYTSDAADDM
eukprot:12020559-Prorocentrum_lima.AAC.1